MNCAGESLETLGDSTEVDPLFPRRDTIECIIRLNASCDHYKAPLMEVHVLAMLLTLP